jgi:hypothetical protein
MAVLGIISGSESVQIVGLGVDGDAAYRRVDIALLFGGITVIDLFLFDFAQGRLRNRRCNSRTDSYLRIS